MPSRSSPYKVHCTSTAKGLNPALQRGFLMFPRCCFRQKNSANPISFARSDLMTSFAQTPTVRASPAVTTFSFSLTLVTIFGNLD